MPLRRQVLGVSILIKYDLRFGVNIARTLGPEERDRSSNLHKWAKRRLGVKSCRTLTLVDCQDLLRLHKVRHLAKLVNASFEVPCACVVPRPSADQNKRAVLAGVLEVGLADIAMNLRQHPELLVDAIVKVFNQMMIPQVGDLPRFIFCHLIDAIAHHRSWPSDFHDVIPIEVELLHYVLLQGVRQVVSVGKVEACFVWLKRLEQLKILVFVLAILPWGVEKQLHHLCLFDLVDRVLANLCHSLPPRDQD